MSKDRELKIRVSAETTDAVDELKSVSNSVEELGKKGTKSAKEVTKVDSAVEKAASRSKKAKKEIESLGKSVETTGTKSTKAAKKVESVGTSASNAGAKAQKGKKNIEDLSVSFRTLSSKATEAQKGLKALGDSVVDTSQRTKDAKSSWAELAMGINQSMDIANKAIDYTKAAWDFSKESAKVEETRQAFESYSASIGVSSDEIISSLKKASSITISNQNLILTASKAMSLGVTTDATKMGNLLEIARNKARLFGVETTQAFDDIVIGIGRLSPLILDNLGIRIPAGFDKMTEGMTAAEKTSKLLDLTLAEGNKQLVEMGGIVDTNADKIRQFEAAVENLKSSLGEGFLPLITPVVEMLTKMARVTGVVIEKLRILHDFSGKRENPNPYLGKPVNELQQLKGKTQSSINDYEWKLSAYNPADPEVARKLSGRNANEIALEKQPLQLNLKAEKQRLQLINEALDKQIEKIKAKAEAEKSAADAAAASAKEKSKTGEEADKKKLDNTDALLKKHANLADSFKPLIANEREAYNIAKQFLLVAGGFAPALKNGITKAGELADEFERVKELSDNIANTLSGGGKNWSKELAAYTPEKMVTFGMNMMTTGLFSATGTDVKKDTKEGYSVIKMQLVEDLSSAVQNGIINSDIAGALESFGSSLGGALSRTYTANNPIISSDNSFNFSSFLGGFAITTATSWLAKSLGGIFKDKNKEKTMTQYSDIKTGVTQNYLNSYAAQLSPYASDYSVRGLEDARDSAHGISVGHKWKRKGFSKEYKLVDHGASAAMVNLADAIGYVEKQAKQSQQGIEMLSSKGLDFKALTQQVWHYGEAVNRLWKIPDTATLTWSETGTESLDLSDDKHELLKAFEEMSRALGQAKAERTSTVAGSFAQYYPWYDPYTEDRTTYECIRGTGQHEKRTSSPSVSWSYGNFESLQNNYMDRHASPAILEMIKQAGSKQYELAELQHSDPAKYAEEYASYIERQMNAQEEVMKRMEAIYKNSSKTFEEQSQALQDYESAQAGYYNSKLELLSAEQAQQEAVKRKELEAQTRSRTHLESALSLYGELSQRGDRIAIIQGGDVTGALKNAIQKYADDPEMIAVLQGALKLTEDKARWG